MLPPELTAAIDDVWHTERHPNRSVTIRALLTRALAAKMEKGKNEHA
jgi:metal-responsive CopG/Arc/MetJ family transcriptional regulator